MKWCPPQIITFLLLLLYDLSYRGLQFASMTNLEAGPRFAGIWCPLFWSPLYCTPLLCILTSECMLAHQKNDQKHKKMMKKVPFSSCTRETHIRLMKKKEEKILLVSDWEWLPKAGWHLKAGCSFGFFFYKFLSVFDRFRPCECMRKHAFTGRNTQHTSVKKLNWNV